MAGGSGYFDIDEAGEVVLTASSTRGAPLSVKRVVDDLIRRGLKMPLLLRFSDILRARLEALTTAFNDKITEYEYQGAYRPVLPIKVNQQRHVVEELLEFGESHALGLEAGSKPELLVAIALLGSRPDGLLVCNGYKDRAYIETALLAQRLGIRTLIIVDRFDELELIIEASQALGLAPRIGLRTKIASKGSGRWADTAGDKSKFGLTASELVLAVDRLAEVDMLDRLVALHFHIGSQITAIRAIKDALAESMRIYANLYQMGAPLAFVDVGGGLAVDYDGSRTKFHASKNYSMTEYAADVVHAIGSMLDDNDIPHPTILSESGRAMVAHQAVLVFDVLGQASPTTPKPGSVGPRVAAADHQVIEELAEIAGSVTRKNYQEIYHDAVQLKADALSLFRHGILDLRERALAEQLFWKTAQDIARIVRELDYVPEDLQTLEKDLCDIYFCNFSVFQSVPDSWAVKHLFPIMPLHRLNDEPTRRAVLADLTCDSDGKISQFIDLHDVKSTLELHPYSVDEPYFLGIFLVGAYQEILGDLHNLFGDVHAVHIRSDPQRGYKVSSIVEGDTVRDVLGYVSYDHRQLIERLRGAIEVSLAAGSMTFEESAALVRHFEAGMGSYTYLEDRSLAPNLLNSVIPQHNGSAAAGDGDEPT